MPPFSLPEAARRRYSYATFALAMTASICALMAWSTLPAAAQQAAQDAQDKLGPFERFIHDNPSVVKIVWGGMWAAILALTGLLVGFFKTSWAAQTAMVERLSSEISGLAKLHHADIVVIKDLVRESIDHMGTKIDAKLVEIAAEFRDQQAAHEQRLSHLEGEHNALAKYHLRRHGDPAKVSGENGGGD